eukprot:CAMPEP_0173094756 /NCGR_PEP_ID=MMETSP1102-20130122/31311_1 /TAXON_ID=49646 /ORGANISM="Geminigera sp., Strain Caron Lab Isolate" /LENGTH=271 /DNA_ID=CAMNT_0013984095 /DNA_START=41 /DNA_END=856 /DNA_ORIENTATION=-
MGRPATDGGSPMNATNNSFGGPEAITFNKAPRQGSYSRWSSSMSKTMGGKLNSPSRLGTPGPGAYSPNSSMMHAAPRYSLSPRRNHLDHMAFVPGPGAYDPNNPAHKPRGVSLGQRINVYGVNTVTPGPAAYNVDDATGLSRGSGSNVGTKGGRRGAPSWSFGLKAGAGAMGVSLGTPGPGAYSPSARSVAMTGQSLSYSMTARTIPRNHHNTPGPGAYNINYGNTRRGTFTSSKHSIHAKCRSLEASNYYTPGPGQYEAPQQFSSVPLPG